MREPSLDRATRGFMVVVVVVMVIVPMIEEWKKDKRVLDILDGPRGDSASRHSINGSYDISYYSIDFVSLFHSSSCLLSGETSSSLRETCLEF